MEKHRGCGKHTKHKQQKHKLKTNNKHKLTKKKQKTTNKQQTKKTNN